MKTRTDADSKVSNSTLFDTFSAKKCPFEGLKNDTNNSRRFIRSPRRRGRAAYQALPDQVSWRS